MAKPLHPAVAEFIERLAIVSELEGLPRIAGRLMGYLLVHGGPVSFKELADRLEVSRGSISTNARILEDRGILERVAKAGDRQDYFRITDDPYGSIIAGHITRMERMIAVLADARPALPPDAKEGARRLEEMERFYHYAMDRTRTFLEGWHVERRKPAK